MIFKLFAPFIFSTSILRPLHTLTDSTHSYCLCLLLSIYHYSLTASTHSYGLYTLLRPLHTLTASTHSYSFNTLLRPLNTLAASALSYGLCTLLRPRLHSTHSSLYYTLTASVGTHNTLSHLQGEGLQGYAKAGVSAGWRLSGRFPDSYSFLFTPPPWAAAATRSSSGTSWTAATG
jgi:hypothetical protein